MTATGTSVRTVRSASSPPRDWILLCAAAELLGMTTAAGAARIADGLLHDPSSWDRVLAWTAVLSAALVEALALSLALAGLLRRSVPALPARRFTAVTVAVATAFWAAASAPSLTTSTSAGGSDPPLVLIVLGGAMLGAVAGGLMGSLQTLTFSEQVRHRWVWTAANVTGWSCAMAVMMVGATTPTAQWPWPAVLGWAAFVGLLAGGVLGAVLSLFAPSLQGTPPQDRAVLRLLRAGRPRRLGGAVIGLRLTGRRSGRTFDLPVMYADSEEGLWVAVGRSQRKTWWRNVTPHVGIEVLQHGAWRPGSAELVPASDPRYAAGLAAYVRRWPRAEIGAPDPLVLISAPQQERL